VPTLASVGILLNISQYAALGKRAPEDGEYEEDWDEAPRARKRRPPQQRTTAVARARMGERCAS